MSKFGYGSVIGRSDGTILVLANENPGPYELTNLSVFQGRMFTIEDLYDVKERGLYDFAEKLDRYLGQASENVMKCLNSVAQNLRLDEEDPTNSVVISRREQNDDVLLKYGNDLQDFYNQYVFCNQIEELQM